MYYIHIGVVNELAEVVIGLHRLIEVLLGCGYCGIQMFLVHIAQGYQAAGLVTGKVVAGTSYTAYTDDTAC